MADDEDDDIPRGCKNERERLLVKRAELVSMLKSVKHSLTANEQPHIAEDVRAGSDSKGPKFWYGKRFSERGEEKARELFDMFSNKADDTMGFFEFRSYLQGVGRSTGEIEPHLCASQETFRAAMHDLVGTNELGRLTPKGFVRYREGIETKYPLEFDLLRCGLSLLPKKLAQWRVVNDAFDLLATENMSQKELQALQKEGIEWVPVVPLRELQLLAWMSGEVINSEMLEWLSILHFRHNKIMAGVRAEYRRKHKFSEHQASLIDSTNSNDLYRDGIAACWFSGRPRQVLRTMEYLALSSKCFFQRRLRDAGHALSSLVDRVSEVTEGGFIVAAVISRVRQEIGRYIYSFEIGDAEAAEDGFGAHLTLTRVENPAKAFSQMGLSPGIGTAFVVDFQLRPDTPGTAVLAALEGLSKMMEEHCVPELERLSTFHSFKVLKWKDEGIEIIRVAVMLKAESSLDLVLKKFQVGLKFADVLSELNVSVQFSAPLNEMLESSKFLLGHQLNGSGSVQTIVARKILCTLLEEILYCLETKESAARIENEERRGGYNSAFQRTRASLAGSQSNKTAGRESRSGEPSITGWQAGARTQTDAEMGARHHRAQGWRFLAWTVVSILKAAKANTTELRFENAAELLLGNAYVNARLPNWLSREAILSPGGVAALWKSTCSFIKLQLDKHWRRVVFHEMAQKVWSDQEIKKRQNRLAKMSEKERARLAFEDEKKALAEQLASLGLDGDAGMAVVKDELSDMERARKSKNERIASERRVLELYEACHGALYSFHGVILQSGTQRFTLAFQGLDLFDMLPQPPPSPQCLVP